MEDINTLNKSSTEIFLNDNDENDDNFQVDLNKKINEILNIDNIISKKSYKILDELGGISNLFHLLKVNPSSGLKTGDYYNENLLPNKQTIEYKKRKEFFGIFEPKNYCSIKNFFIIFFYSLFFSKVSLFLILFSSIKLFINYIYNNKNFFDFISIYIFIFFYCFVDSFKNYQTEKLKHNYYKKLNEKEIRVLRNEKEIIIKRNRILIGDIIIITSGDILLFDGIVILTSALTIENLKGRIKHIKNLNYNLSQDINDFPILLSGTKIINGYALLLVLNCKCYNNININQFKMNKKILKIKEINDNNNLDIKNYTLDESLLYKDYKNITKDNENNNDNFNEITPIQKKIFNIFIFCFILSILLALIIIFFYRRNIYLNNFNVDQFFKEIPKFFINSEICYYYICLIILFFPFGLITLYNILMIKIIIKFNNIIIKDLNSIEYMTGLKYFCCDYYGIFTKNKIKINNIFIEEIQVDKNNLNNLKQQISEKMFELFSESIAINTISFIAQKNNENKFFGNEIEKSLLYYLSKLNIDYKKIRNNPKRLIINSYPYISEGKLSYTIIKMDDKWEYVRLYIKGTPETLLKYITKYLSPGLVLEDFNKEYISKIKMKIDIMINNFIYPLIICYRDIELGEFNEFIKNKQKNKTILNVFLNNLNFICLIGLEDEIQSDVGKNVKKIEDMGINFKLITSLGMDISSKVAEKIFYENKNDSNMNKNIIINNNDNVIMYEQEKEKLISNEMEIELNEIEKQKNKTNNINLNNTPKKHVSFFFHVDKIIDAQNEIKKNVQILSDEKNFTFNIMDLKKFYDIIKDNKIISNASSKDKFIISSTLKKDGNYIAITGQSINDIIPMKIANIAIAMNNNNDLSLENSDIILLDNNFKNIIKIITNGRNLFICLKIYFEFFISFILGFLLFLVIYTIFNFQFFINKILYLLLFINVFEVISLGMVKTDNNFLKKLRPEMFLSKNYLIEKNFLIRIILRGIYIFILFIFFILFFKKNVILFDSMLFNFIVYLIILNALTVKYFEEEIFIFKNLPKNILFVFIQICFICFQIFIINNFYFKKLFKVLDLSYMCHLQCFLFALIIIFFKPLYYYLYLKNVNKFQRDFKRKLERENSSRLYILNNNKLNNNQNSFQINLFDSEDENEKNNYDIYDEDNLNISYKIN